MSGSGSPRFLSLDTAIRVGRLNLLILGTGAAAIWVMYKNAEIEERHSREAPGSYQHQFAFHGRHKVH